MTNILISIGFLFSIIGVISYFFNYYIFSYIGTILIFIGYIIDYFSRKIKNISWLLIIIVIAILFSIISKHNYFDINLFMFIICIEVIITYIIGLYGISKKNNSIDYDKSILDKYFYCQGCFEMKYLIFYWNSQKIYDDNYRIKELEAYQKLETDTAKIVFLFNILLDLNDSYNNYIVYISKNVELNSEYVKNTKTFLNKYKTRLEVANNILNNLFCNTYFLYYKNEVKEIVECFNNIYKLINSIYEKTKDVNYINQYELNALKIWLTAFTNKLIRNFEKLQESININDYKFNSFKKLDSQKCVNKLKEN